MTMKETNDYIISWMLKLEIELDFPLGDMLLWQVFWISDFFKNEAVKC